MNLPLFFTLFFLLTLGSLWIGKKAAKNSTSQEDFLLSGRSIGLFPLVMTLLATQLGGGALMGAAEEAYVRGWSVLFYPLGMVGGLIVLGMGFGAKMRRLQLTTVAELFESVYGSISLRTCASLLSIVSLFLILTAQAIAARKFFSALGFETDLLFTTFWVILVAYTVLGGLKAVVQTDILQASFILVAFLATFLWLVSQPTPLMSTAILPSSASPSIPWLTWFLMPLLFMLIEQDMGQRCFAARRPKTVSYASCLAAGLLLVACLCPIYFGVLAGKRGLSIPEGSSVLITAVKTFTTPTLSTLLILSILMAIISTADSLLCSITSNISVDFPFLRRQSLTTTRLLTLAIGILTWLFSFVFKSVVSVLMFSYELSVSVLFIPIFFAVLFKKPKKISAYVSMVAGALGYFCFKELPMKELWTLSFSFLGFIVAEKIGFWKKENA